MSPTPVGSRSEGEVSQAPLLAQVSSESAASARPGSSPHVDRPARNSRTLEHRADPIQRIEVHVSILISKMVLVKPVTIQF